MTTITEKTVRGARAPEKGQIFIREPKTGFAVRVIATGAVSFCWEGRIKGTGVKRRVTIGQHPNWSVSNAAAVAAQLRAMAAKGQDPAGERIVAREQLTFAQLVAWYLENYARPHRKTWRTDERRLKALGVWDKRRLADITPDDIGRMHVRIGASRGRVESNRTIQLLRSAFNAAIAADVWKGTNPAKGVKLFAEQSRERFLSPAELVAVSRALLAETEDWRWRSYFPLLLLTGLRRRELASLRWEHVDLTARTLRLPTTKSGRSHRLPIPSAAAAIIEGLPSRGAGGVWLFPSRGKSGHIENPAAVWARVRERAGCPDCTIHDLRRSCGSWLAAAGASLPQIGAVLGHKNPRSTQIYARMNLDATRAMLEHNALLMFPATPADGDA